MKPGPTTANSISRRIRQSFSRRVSDMDTGESREMASRFRINAGREMRQTDGRIYRNFFRHCRLEGARLHRLQRN